MLIIERQIGRGRGERGRTIDDVERDQKRTKREWKLFKPEIKYMYLREGI